MDKALIFCAHPDDEVIALGGTIRKLANQGVEITVVMFANGNEGYTDINMKNKIVEIRRKEREDVGKILGVSNYEAFDYGDFGIPANEETYKLCIKMIRKYKPDVIFTHYWKEYMAHKAVATVATEAWWQAGWECSLELGNPWKVRALYHFEVLEPLSDVSHIVNISNTFDTKLKAMEAYVSQHDVVAGVIQKIEGLAKFRGASIGIKYGEALLKSTFVPEGIEDIKTL